MAKSQFEAGDVVDFRNIKDGEITHTGPILQRYANGLPSCREPMIKIDGYAGLVLESHCSLRGCPPDHVGERKNEVLVTEINASSRRLRDYIHELEMNSPIACYVQENTLLKDMLHNLNVRFDEFKERINTPKIVDFIESVKIESAHQRARWPEGHDDGKTNADWFWLIGWLGGKAVHNPVETGENPKAKRLHRIITVAAAAYNWWSAVAEKTN